MENIIQQIALDLVEKITKKLFKEKNRKRSILTELGTLNLPRDYFLIKLATVMFLSWMQCWDFKDMNASAAMSEQGL